MNLAELQHRVAALEAQRQNVNLDVIRQHARAAVESPGIQVQMRLVVRQIAADAARKIVKASL